MKLYETITAENWCKGSEWVDTKSPQMCLEGHKAFAYEPDEWGRVNLALTDAVRALYPERGQGAMRVYPHLFNDHPDTTVEDVIRVCKVADV